MQQVGVVLDGFYTDTLLHTSFREGLMTSSSGESTDKIFHRYEQPTSDVDPAALTKLLENVILAKPLHIYVPGYEYLHGPLIDSGMISFLPEGTSAKSVEEENMFSIDFLLPFLAARGTHTTLDEILNELRKGAELEEEVCSHFGKIPDIMNLYGEPLDEVLHRILSPTAPSKYTASDLTLLRSYQTTRHHLHPVSRAIEELCSIERDADKLNTNRLLHIAPVSSSAGVSQHRDTYLNSDLTLVPGSAEYQELRLFKIACASLGRIPVRPTLEETIALSQLPETRALREQVDHWVASISDLKLDEAAVISREIKNTAKWLHEADKAGKAFEVLGIIGLPLAIGSLALPDLVASGLTGAGVALSAMGAVATAAKFALNRKFRWMMFGS